MQGNLSGLAGVFCILAIAVLFSTSRRNINISVVTRAFAMQVLVAVLVLYVPAGRNAIGAMSHGVTLILGYADAGIDMVFGPLVSHSGPISFAVQVLPIIIFFSALMSVLYHLRIMQTVVFVLGGFLHKVIGTRPVESVNAATTVFVGQSEAPLTIRPYLSGLSDAQVFAVMVSGFASVAGSLLAAYAQMGIRIDYLLAASFMSAPGGLLMAKLIMPEPRNAKASEDADLKEITRASSPHTNVIMAAAVGAQDGLKVAVSVGAMLLAFVALIALLDGMIGFSGSLFGAPHLTLESMLGTLFAPVMYLLNVPWSEAKLAGGLFGEKLILNEFVAYLNLGKMTGALSPRTIAVVTFALCGFANFSSIAIQMGCLGLLAPEKRTFVARFGLRGVLAGSLSNLMSAALASLLLSF